MRVRAFPLIFKNNLQRVGTNFSLNIQLNFFLKHMALNFYFSGIF